MHKLGWCKTSCWILALGAAGAIVAYPQALGTLASLGGPVGAHPSGGLIQATDGNFYGTAYDGGANDFGTVFKITPSGTLTALHSFASSDGANPYAGLIQAADGTFYGTTNLGGAHNLGTVFHITAEGVLTTLYSFGSNDGANPYAGLIQAADGNLYGATENGGSSTACTYGCGTVFKITPQGMLTTLHSFAASDGAHPEAGLAQAADGTFYGTTYQRGAMGYGTVFKVTSHGRLTTLHSFTLADGANPAGGLLLAAGGMAYGTTFRGGADNSGTIFEVTKAGAFKSLYSFTDATDGGHPLAGLVEGSDGNLYGCAYDGGFFGYGTIFKITPVGNLTRLYTFYGYYQSLEGAYCRAGLLQSTNGNFYGTTTAGGYVNDGIVFGPAVRLGPFVKVRPSFGSFGAAITILGTNLTGATSVAFNGTAAAFTVNSSGSAISTTVPDGATTGAVQVITPNGTLSSTVPFRVKANRQPRMDTDAHR